MGLLLLKYHVSRAISWNASLFDLLLLSLEPAHLRRRTFALLRSASDLLTQTICVWSMELMLRSTTQVHLTGRRRVKQFYDACLTINNTLDSLFVSSITLKDYMSGVLLTTWPTSGPSPIGSCPTSMIWQPFGNFSMTRLLLGVKSPFVSEIRSWSKGQNVCCPGTSNSERLKLD